MRMDHKIEFAQRYLNFADFRFYLYEWFVDYLFVLYIGYLGVPLWRYNQFANRIFAQAPQGRAVHSKALKVITSYKLFMLQGAFRCHPSPGIPGVSACQKRLACGFCIIASRFEF